MLEDADVIAFHVQYPHQARRPGLQRQQVCRHSNSFGENCQWMRLCAMIPKPCNDTLLRLNEYYNPELFGPSHSPKIDCDSTAMFCPF